VDEHIRLRQLTFKGMVVGDDQLKPERAGSHRLGNTGDPAVDRDNEPSPLLLDRCQSPGIEPVALIKAVGHIPEEVCIERLQAARQNGRRGHPISVVVAVDAQPLPRFDRGHDPVGGLRHPGQQLRITKV
jgi:hypothetical protein